MGELETVRAQHYALRERVTRKESYLPNSVAYDCKVDEKTFVKSDVKRFTPLTDFQYTRGEEAVDAWEKTIENVYRSFASGQRNELGKEGDAVISAFNLAQNALSAALDAQRELAQLPDVYGPNEEDNPAWQKLKMRIGLATGPCYTGHATSGNRRIPVFGGPVVDAAYLTEEASPVGGVAADERTKMLLPDVEFTPRLFKDRTVWVPTAHSIQPILSNDERTELLDENYYKAEIERLQAYEKYLDTFFPKPILELVGKEYPGRYQPATIFFAQLPMLHEIVEQAIDKENPDDVRAAYDATFRALQPAIEQNGGIVLKLYKDKVIAGFGLPHVEEKAVRHARRMHRQLESNWKDDELMRLAHKYQAENQPFLVGAIHHGRNIFTGMLGTEQRRGYDLLGDDVNIAARLAAQSMSTDDTDLRGPVRIIYSKEALEQDREVTLVTKRVTKFVPKGKTQEFTGHVITSEEEKQAKTLIGREKEVKDLDKLVNGLFTDNQSRTVHISAPPGYGKTELTKVLIEQFKAKQGEVYTANSLEYARDVPDQVMQGLLRNILSLKEGQSKEQLTSIVNEKIKEDKRYVVNQWLSLGLDYTGPSLSLSQLSEKRTETLAELLNTGKKTLVVLNDIHWADMDSLLKWQKLTERLQENVIFATNYRNTDLPDTHKTIVEKGLHINIAEFDEKGTAQLLERLIDAAPEQKLIELTYKQSKGVPLYIEEVAAFLLQEQHVQNGRLTKDVSEIKLPGSIQDIILARYDKLKEEELGMDARRYLEFASAMYGDEWSKDFLNIKNRDAVMKLLTDRGFLKQNGTIGWHHNLTKKAIYGNIRPEIRKQKHEAIGRLIENRYKVKTDQNALNQHLLELAYHFEHGEDLEKAIKYNYLAAKMFIDSNQNKTGLTFVGKIESFVEDKKLSENELLQYGYAVNVKGAALYKLKDLKSSDAAYKKCFDILNRLSEKAKPLLSLRLNLNYALLQRDVDEGLAMPYFEKALEVAKHTQNRFAEGIVKYNIALILPSGDAQIILSQEAIQILTEFGKTTHLSRAYCSHGAFLRDNKRYNEARNAIKESISIAAELKDLELQGRCFTVLATIDKAEGKLEDAMDSFSAAEKLLCKIDEKESLALLYEEWSDSCLKLNLKEDARKICLKWEQLQLIPRSKRALEKIKKEL